MSAAQQTMLSAVAHTHVQTAVGQTRTVSFLQPQKARVLSLFRLKTLAMITPETQTQEMKM